MPGGHTEVAAIRLPAMVDLEGSALAEQVKFDGHGDSGQLGELGHLAPAAQMAELQSLDDMHKQP